MAAAEGREGGIEVTLGTKPLWRVSLALFAGTLAVNAAFHATWPLRLGGDQRRYCAVARHAVAGDGLILDEDHVAWVPPGYPLLLAGVWSLTGTSKAAGLAVQFVLCGLMVVLTQRLAARLFDARVGTLAGLLALFYPRFIGYAGNLRTETLAVFLSVLVIVLVVRAVGGSAGASPSPSLRWAGAAGLCLGYLALTRPSNLPLVGVVALWLLVARGLAWRRRLGLAAAMMAAVAAALAPWTWRNYRLLGRFVPITTQAGLAASIGVARVQGEGVVVTQAGPVRIDCTIGNDEADSDLAPVLRYYREHPWDLPRHVAARFTTLWRPGQWLEAYPPFARWLAYLYWASLVPLGLVGLALALRRRRPFVLALLLVPLTLTAVHSLFIGMPRYNLPAVPFVFILASYALCHWRREQPERDAAGSGGSAPLGT